MDIKEKYMMCFKARKMMAKTDVAVLLRLGRVALRALQRVLPLAVHPRDLVLRGPQLALAGGVLGPRA